MLKFTVFAGMIEKGPRKGQQTEPEPQGSAKAFMPPGAKWPVVTSDNADLARWRKFVKEAAEAAIFEFPGVWTAFESPMHITLGFFMVRPQSRKKDEYHVTRPDLDKLCRGVLDGLKEGGVFKDDSQVCSLTAGKFYGWPPRCEVIAMPLEGGSVCEVAPKGEHSNSAPRTRNPSGPVPAGDSGLLANSGKLFP